MATSDKQSNINNKLADRMYNPIHFKELPESEFGKSYEGILPSEAEVRFLGNRNYRCYYYAYGLEVCKYEVLKKKNTTFLPCKDAMDALWRCYTDGSYGNTMEEAPQYVKPMQKKFYDCFFHKLFGLDFCMGHFTDMVRVIYRRPDSKLTKWF